MSDTNTSRKVFVSYKYSDKHVRQPQGYNQIHWLLGAKGGDYFTVRDYVDILEDKLVNDYGHIYKGEKDDEPLDHFKDETIESKLRNKIFDSTITIVLISKMMKNLIEPEDDQWIPWEISYSLKEMTKNGRTSGMNGMLAVVLPDENNSYDHAVIHKNCVTIWQTNSFFDILDKNMFNRKDKNQRDCDECGGIHHYGSDHSYIHPVKWDNFISDVNYYINHAGYLQDNKDDFDIRKMGK